MTSLAVLAMIRAPVAVASTTVTGVPKLPPTGRVAATIPPAVVHAATTVPSGRTVACGSPPAAASTVGAEKPAPGRPVAVRTCPPAVHTSTIAPVESTAAAGLAPIAAPGDDVSGWKAPLAKGANWPKVRRGHAR